MQTIYWNQIVWTKWDSIDDQPITVVLPLPVITEEDKVRDAEARRRELQTPR